MEVHMKKNEHSIIALRPNTEISLLLKNISHIRSDEGSNTSYVIEALNYCAKKDDINFKLIDQSKIKNVSIQIADEDIKATQFRIPTHLIATVKEKIKKEYSLEVVQQRFLIKLSLMAYTQSLLDDNSDGVITVVSWNCNQSCLLKDKNKSLPNFILKEVSAYDIFILQEVFNLKEKALHYQEILSDFELYYRDVDPINKVNEILIGVRKCEKYETLPFVDFQNIPQLPIDSPATPNSLVTKIKKGNAEVAIIGIRIRQTDYIGRAKQLATILDYTRDMGKVVLAGDFNNSRIFDPIEKCYLEVREQYHFTRSNERSVLYDTYNYHILRDYVSARGYVLDKLPENYSHYVGSYGYKLDHLMCKGFLPIKYTYSWDFMENNNTYSNYSEKDDLKDLLKSGNPDHAILKADFKF